MKKINFTITLKADGEPGSGFGTTLVDSLLPRDINGRLIIPSTHIKGLIRENLENLPEHIIPSTAVAELFGKEGDTGALFHICTATAPEDAMIIDITRTKLNPFGTADQGSLRTCEAAACGTEFAGTVTLHRNISPAYEDLLKLGLLSLFAVGGGRNRGAGACIVTIDNETISPGKLLRKLATVDFTAVPPIKPHPGQKAALKDEAVTLKLVFKAVNPVCVPETPIVKNNMICSGFSIPASAVQGAILHRLNDVSEETATACYKSRNFRAWPLNPADIADSVSLRVSFTHKISKLKIDDSDNYHFEDETVKPYDWDKVPSNSPLKAADGVLLADGNSVKLWKSSEMARIVTAHGVHNGDRSGVENAQKRNLYTVEALAPALFTGLVSMPAGAADLFLKSLKEDASMQLGKSRSVRGGGKLSAKKIAFTDLPILKNRKETVFIVQSPLLVPETLLGKPVEKIIAAMTKDFGFGDVEKSSGAIATQFGWNRTVNNGKNGFLGGKPVILPGAVFKVKFPVEEMENKLITGIGEGRENGFGAVLPHPGVAERLFPDAPRPRVIPKPRKNYGKEGFLLWMEARESHLSASQISRVRELTALDPDTAVDYLHRQKNDRPEQIWQRWQGVMERLAKDIQDDPGHTEKVLKVCQDLLVADKGDN